MAASAEPAPGASDTQSLRMLAELDSNGGKATGVATRRRSGWLYALLALPVLAALAWWWSRQAAVPEGAAPIERVVSAAPLDPPKPAGDSASPASPVAAASAAASSASIEVLPDARPVQTALAGSEGPAASAASASSPEATVMRVARPAPRAAAKASNKPAATSGRATSTHDPDPLGTFIARSPKATTASLAAPAAAVTRDADVDLIAALLARVSRDGAGGAIGPQDQTTIAQIVKRCESRGAGEALACKRRICEGYWGKAEACPMRLAPRKS